MKLNSKNKIRLPANHHSASIKTRSTVIYRKWNEEMHARLKFQRRHHRNVPTGMHIHPP